MIKIFWDEFVRNLQELNKYRFNLIFANAGNLLIFYGLTEYLFVQNKEIVFIQLIIWYFVTHGINNPTYTLEEEIMDGTILTIIQSKTHILKVMNRRNFLTIIMDLIKAIPLFTVLYLIGAYDFSSMKNLVWIGMIVIWTIIISYEIGIFLSAFVFTAKRLSSFIGLTYFYILLYSGMIISLPKGLFRTINQIVFPFIHARMLIESLARGLIDKYSLIGLIVQSIFYFIFAIYFFDYQLRKSIRKGVLYGL